jgi:hypothetical protein
MHLTATQEAARRVEERSHAAIAAEAAVIAHARAKQSREDEASDARYASADKAVLLAAGIQARQRRIGELEEKLTGEQRELERELAACQAAAVSATSIKRAGSADTYGSHVRLIADAVGGGGAYLRSVLDRVIEADDARPAAEQRERDAGADRPARKLPSDVGPAPGSSEAVARRVAEQRERAT